MKKLFGFMTCLAVLLAGVMFTGCDDVAKELLGPTNKWCMKTFSFNSDSDTGTAKDVDVYCYYATADKDVVLGSTSTNAKATVTLKKGLNVVLCGNSNATKTSEIFGTVTSGKTPFVVKTFEEGAAISFGSGDSSSNDTTTLKKSVWNLIYVCNSWESYSDKTMPLTNAYTSYESVTDLKDGFSIETILRKMAANKLNEILLGE